MCSAIIRIAHVELAALARLLLCLCGDENNDVFDEDPDVLASKSPRCLEDSISVFNCTEISVLFWESTPQSFSVEKIKVGWFNNFPA